jgi:hypothetical protein
MRSVDAAAEVPGPLAALFVDGDHSYAGVVQDLTHWLPKLDVGGVLLMHDTSWAEGVQRALREIVTPLEIPPRTCLPNLYACRLDSRRLAVGDWARVACSSKWPYAKLP